MRSIACLILLCFMMIYVPCLYVHFYMITLVNKGWVQKQKEEAVYWSMQSWLSFFGTSSLWWAVNTKTSTRGTAEPHPDATLSPGLTATFWLLFDVRQGLRSLVLWPNPWSVSVGKTLVLPFSQTSNNLTRQTNCAQQLLPSLPAELNLARCPCSPLCCVSCTVTISVAIRAAPVSGETPIGHVCREQPLLWFASGGDMPICCY